MNYKFYDILPGKILCIILFILCIPVLLVQNSYCAAISKKGIFDLRNYQWDNGPIALDGEWEFYMVPYGFVIFIVFQSFILAHQNSRLYIKLEKLFSEKIKLENIAATFQNLAYIDPLTELPNRRRFEEYLHTEWHRAIRNQTPLSILMIDIDYFKKYNDKFGHIIGDMVLKKVAETIKSCIHRPADMCARYGGEEFIVILPETEIIGAYRIAERIRKKILDLKLPAAITTSSKFVSVSIGCTTEYPNLGKHWDDIIDKADKKLYRAKKFGRNRTEK